MNESKTTKTSAAKILAQMRYNAKTYDRLELQLKKGTKEIYRQEAKIRDIGLMELFRRGADEYIQNHPPIKKQ